MELYCQEGPLMINTAPVIFPLRKVKIRNIKKMGVDNCKDQAEPIDVKTKQILLYCFYNGYFCIHYSF